MITFSVTPSGTFEEVVERTRRELSNEGFGILTEIDVAATMKQKLDEDMDSYLILGACNPPLAHRAVTADPYIGALLPCNVVVRNTDSGVSVDFMDPQAAMDLVDNEAIHEVGHEAREKLMRVAEALIV